VGVAAPCSGLGRLGRCEPLVEAFWRSCVRFVRLRHVSRGLSTATTAPPRRGLQVARNLQTRVQCVKAAPEPR